MLRGAQEPHLPGFYRAVNERTAAVQSLAGRIRIFNIFVVFGVFVFFFCSHWSLVDIPLIFFCPADHVPDWQPRILLDMVEARSVNVKKTTTTISGTDSLLRQIPYIHGYLLSQLRYRKNTFYFFRLFLVLLWYLNPIPNTQYTITELYSGGCVCTEKTTA